MAPSEGAHQRRSHEYIRLAAHLAGQPLGVARLEMTVDEIEDVIGRSLPAHARSPSWWRNDNRRLHARAWLTAGWRVDHMSADHGRVVFIRAGS